MNAVTNLGKCYRYGKIGKEIDFQKVFFNNFIFQFFF